MQNRYTGDIGDFCKLGLLRTLRAAGLSIGVNWYLTPDETHNGDGRHVEYLGQDKFRACDEELWLSLESIVSSGQRMVKSLEDERMLQATFFSDCLDFRGVKKRDRSEIRRQWYQRSLSALEGCNIVFADPDNGLIVPSYVDKPKENKYVLRQEIAGYYAQHSSVVYYQHRARAYTDPLYTRQLDLLVSDHAFPSATGIALKFPRWQTRYFLFVIQPQHRDVIENAIANMLSTPWGEHFNLL